MSKEREDLDLDNLSPEDAVYASDRGWLSAEQEEKYGIEPNPNGGQKVAEGGSAYDGWSKDELKAHAEERGLSTSGSESQLRKRLDKADAEAAGEAGEE